MTISKVDSVWVGSSYQIGTNAVACSVKEIQTFFPQVLTGQDINGEATSALGEDCHVDSNSSLQDQSESTFLKLGGGTEMESSGGVSSSVIVLTARVTEIDGFRVNDRTASLLGLVVNNSTVRSSRRDGIERKTCKQFVLRANLLKLVSTVDFIQDGLLVDEFVFKPSKVLGQGSSVTDMASPHALKFGLILDSFGVCDRAAGLFDLVLATEADAKSPRSLVGQQKLCGVLARSLAPGSESSSVGENRVVWLYDNVLSQVGLDFWGQFVILDIDLSCGGRYDDI